MRLTYSSQKEVKDRFTFKKTFEKSFLKSQTAVSCPLKAIGRFK